jgi:hypothetical protein
VTPSAQQVKTPQASNAPDLNDAIVKLFSDFDVKETSHHLVISHLDLHICDDIHAKEKGTEICLFQTTLAFLGLSIKLDYLLYMLCSLYLR